MTTAARWMIPGENGPEDYTAEKQREDALIAANGDEDRANQMTFLYMEEDGSTWWADASFYHEPTMAKEFFVPGSGITPFADFGPFKRKMNQIFRWQASKNPAGEKLFELTMGYKPGWGKRSEPQFSHLLDAFAPTASMTDIYRWLELSDEQRERSGFPSKDLEERLIQTFTGIAVHRVAPRGSAERNRQIGTAEFVEKSNEYGTITRTVPAAPSSGEGASGKRKKRGTRQKRQRRERR